MVIKLILTLVCYITRLFSLHYRVSKKNWLKQRISDDKGLIAWLEICVIYPWYTAAVEVVSSLEDQLSLLSNFRTVWTRIITIILQQ